MLTLVEIPHATKAMMFCVRVVVAVAEQEEVYEVTMSILAYL